MNDKLTELQGHSFPETRKSMHGLIDNCREGVVDRHIKGLADTVLSLLDEVERLQNHQDKMSKMATPSDNMKFENEIHRSGEMYQRQEKTIKDFRGALKEIDDLDPDIYNLGDAHNIIYEVCSDRGVL